MGDPSRGWRRRLPAVPLSPPRRRDRRETSCNRDRPTRESDREPERQRGGLNYLIEPRLLLQDEIKSTCTNSRVTSFRMTTQPARIAGFDKQSLNTNSIHTSLEFLVHDRSPFNPFYSSG